MGSSINACTKGIWIWPELLPHPEDPNIKILLLDTEGFGGLDQSLNHDGKINLLALLLSSLFVYNSAGKLDEFTYFYLSFINWEIDSYFIESFNCFFIRNLLVIYSEFIYFYRNLFVLFW